MSHSRSEPVELDRELLLVCTADRPDGTKPGCGAAGLGMFVLLQSVLDASSRIDTWSAIPSGCLGFCERQPVICHPRSGRVWLEVEASSVPSIVDAALAPHGPDIEETT